jgi:TolA-binding protein
MTMNRIATILLVLMVAALAVLLFFRTGPGPSPDIDPSTVYTQPETVLQHVERLINQARDGATAAEQARHTLNSIIENDPVSEQALSARLRLVDLEQSLGNHTAAGVALLDAIQAHPGSGTTPQLIMDLGLLLAGPLDRPDEAQEVFERLVLLYPGHALAPEAAVRLARIRMTGDPRNQQQHWQQFSETYPNSPLGKVWREPESTPGSNEADHE